ncbi:SMC family ATPase [Clostridium sardiniense]
MRPVKLVISAFGPYAEKQELDFRELKGRNIFVITGTTGSGKTTIFDAISYALYGEASGESRENDSLRSHFADDDTETFIELDFELRGDVYKVVRSPKQKKRKTRGEGFTDKEPEAELVLPNGKVITKVKAVNDKITEILGITKEQFKQIVMLPQGEFKKLLLASSVEREGIFRKIFNTYAFEKIQSSLKDKAIKLSKERNLCKEKMKTYLENIQGEHNILIGEYIDFPLVIEELTELIDNEKSSYKQNKDLLNEIKAALEKKNKEKLIGEQNNALLKEKEETTISLEKELLKEADFESKKEILLKIKKAKDIKYIEEKYIDLNKRLEIKDTEYNNSIKDIERLKNELSKQEDFVKVEENNDKLRVELTEEIGKLRNIEPKIEAYEKEKKLIITFENRIKEITTEIRNKQLRLEENKKIREENEAILKNISELEIKKVNLENSIKDETKRINELRDLYEKVRLYEGIKNDHTKFKSEYSQFEIKYKNIKSEYENLEEIYKKEQAGILANELVDGIPCPVCGSLDHPNPASKSGGSIPTEEELKKKKIEFEKYEKKNNEKIINLTEINSNVNNALQHINDILKSVNIGDDFSTYEDNLKVIIRDKGIELKKTIDSINNELKDIIIKINNKDSLQKRNRELEEDIKILEAAIELLNNEDKGTFAKLEGLKASCNNLKKDIPDEVNSINSLAKSIKDKEKQLEDSKNRLIALVKKRDNTIKIFEGEKSKCKEIERSIKELKKDIKKAKEDFVVNLGKEGFLNVDDYNNTKIYIDKIDILDKEIIEYNKKIGILMEAKETLNKKCENISVVSIEEIDDSIKCMKIDEKEKEDKLKQEFSIIDNNMNVLKKVIELNKEFKEKEDEYRVIGELSELSNGRKAPYISFERYVLASYFQDIIDAANLRLEKMTGDRFSLRRKTSKSKGAGQKGLELEVYDNYTASSRDVSSLSGGESFKASLSLALGLSDVVQSNSGGVSLETMFVDEGFGTLDPQSLDNAIDSLLDLQRGGRLVGIISHVEELKERVDAKLEVKATKNGSIAKFNVL